MNIVGVQLDIIWEDKAVNQTHLAELLAANPPKVGSLVVLPEMWATGFSMNVAAISETPGRETEAFMAASAAKYGVEVLGGVVTMGTDGLGRNDAVLFGPDGQEKARYTKLHPFSFGQETAHYGRGSEVVVLDWQGWKVAPFICYDLRFPEVFRRAAELGAELFCVIANWPVVREDHWKTLLKARAIENQAYVLGVNRCGIDPNVAYSGHSLLFDPRGETLADGGMAEGLLTAQLDRAALLAYRREFPALSDRHPDFV